ncbi:MAG: S9 family peptidase, partial [Pseudomonadota bacterium]
MIKNILMSGTALVLLAACGGNEETTEAETTEEAVVETATVALDYPDTMTVDQTDDFYGVTVADPYRWLEDDVRESEDVAQWVEAQNDVTFAYIDTLEMRDPIKDRMTELWDYERFTIPTEEGGKYFYRRNDGLQNQYVYYVQDGLDGEPRALIDPNEWADDGATALAATAVSPGGTHVAYAIQDGGSDWRTVRVLDVETGETLED